MTTEQDLWQEVQRAYAVSRDYRAGDNPRFARAYAAWHRAAIGPREVTAPPLQPSQGE